MPETLFESDLKSLPLVARGKVRDIYGVGTDHLLIVTTDRLSAFDVVLPTAIPGKGAVLTAVSNFWFARTRSAVSRPTRSIVFSKEMFSSWAPSAALVEGVNRGSGSLSASRKPSGSGMPQTAPSRR